MGYLPNSTKVNPECGNLCFWNHFLWRQTHLSLQLARFGQVVLHPLLLLVRNIVTLLPQYFDWANQHSWEWVYSVKQNITDMWLHNFCPGSGCHWQQGLQPGCVPYLQNTLKSIQDLKMSAFLVCGYPSWLISIGRCAWLSGFRSVHLSTFDLFDVASQYVLCRFMLCHNSEIDASTEFCDFPNFNSLK